MITYTPGNAPGTHEPEPKKLAEELWKDAEVGSEPEVVLYHRGPLSYFR